jgi:putative nucleotidyltransferase with HDIG domain
MVLVFKKNKKQTPPRNKGNGNTEMEEYQMRIGLLGDIAEEASSITDVSTLLERILRVTQNSLGSSITALFLKDETKDRVNLPITVSKYEDKERRKATVIESEVANLVASNVAPVIINNVAADPRFNPKGKKPSNCIVRSVIAAPILRGKKVIGVLMAANKDNGGDFTGRDFEVLKGFASTEALILLVSLEKTAIDNVNSLTLNQNLLNGYRSTVHELASTIDVKDAHVYAHSRRVKEYALLAANALSLPPQEMRAIEFGALLHDIGKIGIDSEILCKPGPLTDEEWNIVYQHPQKGASILKDIPHLKDAMNLVLYHHERYDGKGYPEQLKGEEIPIGARLVAVANAFDTMTTDNSYRAALSVDEAIKELIDGTGTQFCPKAIEAFISGFKKYNGYLPVEENPGEIPAQEVKELKNLKEDIKKEAKELKNLKTNVKKEAKEAKIKAEKESQEAKALKIKDEKETKKSKKLKTGVKKEAKESKNLKIKAQKEAKGAKIKAEKEAKEAKLLKIKAEKEDKEANLLKIKAEKEAKKVKKAAREQKITPAKIETEISKGNIRLIVPITIPTDEVNKFREDLKKIEGVKIFMLSHSEEEGHLFLLSLEKPITLMRFIKETPRVESVNRKGKEIFVTLTDEPS